MPKNKFCMKVTVKWWKKKLHFNWYMPFVVHDKIVLTCLQVKWQGLWGLLFESGIFWFICFISKYFLFGFIQWLCYDKWSLEFRTVFTGISWFGLLLQRFLALWDIYPRVLRLWSLSITSWRLLKWLWLCKSSAKKWQRHAFNKVSPLYNYKT